MNREDIIRMAREAGIEDWWDSGNEHREVLQEHLERFAALVASAEREVSVNALRTLNETYEIELRKAIATEREACAQVCDDMDSMSDYYALRVELICANAIRARGQA